MQQPAPIVLFVYNRPWHTRQTVEALQKNDLASESELFIYADGAKNNEASPAMQEVRDYIKTISGLKKITIIERDKNWGLADNIIDGVSTLVNQFGKIIVLEDDLVTAKGFLKYMNEALEVYEKDLKVFSISAYIFSIETEIVDTFLSPLGTSSWGWATWKDRWNHFQHSPLQIKELKNESYILNRFNFAGYDYAAMFSNKNSWAIKWYYTVFERNGLGLYPTKSLVHNIGNDGTGINTAPNTVLNNPLGTDYIKIEKKEVISFKFNNMLSDFFLNTYFRSST